MTETRINPENWYGGYDTSSQRPPDGRPSAAFPYAEQAPYRQAPPDAWNSGAWNGNTGQGVIDGTVSGAYRVPPGEATGGIPMYGATGAPGSGNGAAYRPAPPNYQQSAPQPGAYQQQQPPSYRQPAAPGYQGAPGYYTDPSFPQSSAPYPPPGAGYPPPPSTPPPGSGYGQRPPAGYPAQAAATQTMTPPPFPAVPGPFTPPPYPAVPGPATPPPYPAVPGPGTPPPYPAVPGPGTPPPFPAVPGGPGATGEPTLFRVLREREQQHAYGEPFLQPSAPAVPQAPPRPAHRVMEAEPMAGRASRNQPEIAASSETALVAADEDEKLLQALKKIVSFVKNDSLFPRLIFIILGYTAIGPLAFAYIEAVPLHISATFILAPAVLTMIALGIRFPYWGRRALIGWIAGIVATTIYDVLRLVLVEVGFWDDPIPAIGNLLLVSDQVPWWVGYAWRFMGNGGGMAIAFTMLPWRGVKAGLIYGTLINTGLFVILYFFPVAQTHFFQFGLLTLMAGYAGHWTYGGIVGAITKRFLPPPQISLIKDGNGQQRGGGR